MFCNHEIRYIKKKSTSKSLRTHGQSGEIIVNVGYLPNVRKRAKDPSDADMITIRNRAWRENDPPKYFYEPQLMDTNDPSDIGVWTYWEHNVS